MKGLMKAAKKDPAGDPYLSNPEEGVETQEENLEVSESEVEKAMKPAISQSKSGDSSGDNPNTHNSSKCDSKFRTFTSTQREMGEIG